MQPAQLAGRAYCIQSLTPYHFYSGVKILVKIQMRLCKKKLFRGFDNSHTVYHY